MKNEEKSNIKKSWLQEQEYFQNKIFQYPLDCSKIRRIAGVDVAYTKIEGQEYGCCSIIIIDYNTLEIIQKISGIVKVDVKYEPGFFSFRELPVILETVKKIKNMPDIFVFDGNGILHPRRMGIATHASFYLNRPCIGVAKNFYHFESSMGLEMPEDQVGASTNIISNTDEVLGIALKTKKSCKPVYVSVGNFMLLENAKEIIMHCISKKSRIPIPTRLADIETHKIRKEFLEKRSN